MSKLKINPALTKTFRTRSRYKVLYGGRGSSKSFNTALHAIFLASNYSLKFLCIRQFQNNIKESVHTLIKDNIYALGMQDQFDITNRSIRHKEAASEFVFYGIARNFMEIKSFEGADICWIEEAHALSKEQFDVIDPTIRKENSEIWIIFNPQNRADYTFQRFVESPPANCVVQKINYNENPFLSKTMLDIIAEAEKTDKEEYAHIYLGEPRESDDKALFAWSEIEQAMNGDLEGIDMTGVFTYAADVARYGNDKCVLTKRKGYHIYFMESYSKYSTMEYANAINGQIIREQGRPDGIFVDTIGVGAGVYDRLRELGVRSIEANVSMKADETEIYYNKRAEMYFNLRDFIRKGGKIPNDKELKEELLAIRYFFSNANGKMQIQSKDDIKELIGRSPDKSDSIAMHFFSKIRPMSMRNRGNSNVQRTSLYDR